MKEIQLTQGKVALVDDDLYEELNQFKWHARKHCRTFYAGRMTPIINGTRSLIQMHYEIIGFPPTGFITDHKNGNGLRNLRSNLRFVTSRQNSQNLKNIKKTSKYPGVSWYKSRKRWVAAITIRGIHRWLGQFVDEEKAFEAYKQAVRNIGDTVVESDDYVY